MLLLFKEETELPSLDNTLAQKLENPTFLENLKASIATIKITQEQKNSSH